MKPAKLVIAYLGPKKGEDTSNLSLLINPAEHIAQLPEEQGPFEFISADQASVARALIIVRFPIPARVVASVEWVRVTQTKRFVRFGLQDYSEGTPPISLSHGAVRDAAPHEAAILNEADYYYRPITSKSYAPKLLTFVRTLQGEEYADAMRTFGRSAKRDQERMRRARFICTQYPKWQASEATYEQAAAHCRQHSIDIAAEALKHFMARTLKLQLSRDQGFVRDIFI